MQMAEYRAYIVGDDGHIVSFRAFICDTDADATVWATQMVDRQDVELWSRERFVIRLRPSDRDCFMSGGLERNGVANGPMTTTADCWS